MKKKIDYDKHKGTLNHLVPLLLVMTIIGAGMQVYTENWVNLFYNIYSTFYVLLSVKIQLQERVSKRFAIVVLLSTIIMGLSMAYRVWDQDYVGAIMGVILMILVSSNVKKYYGVEESQEIKEEK